MRSNEQPLAWRIDPLPDFLLDHTLTEEASPSRLREIVARWVQFVAALWRWKDEASFALRFTSDGDQIRGFLLAAATNQSGAKTLDEDLCVLMRAHGLPYQTLTALSADSNESPFWNLGGSMAIAEVCQHITTRLWRIPPRVVNNPQTKREFDWVPDAIWKNTPTMFPWWAPGGPFLLPMEKLISQSVPCSLTAYIAPTSLTSEEWHWLAFLARTAQSFGDHQDQSIDQAMAERRVDPAATLAGRLAMANLRRLSDKPYLINVHCAAGGNNETAARSIAGTIESIVYETPFDRPQQEDDRLPSAASVRVCEDNNEYIDRQAAIAQYETVHFYEKENHNPLSRLQFLADARGASTVFRLPVNVRGGVPGFRVAQRPPDFHPGPRKSHVPHDHILIGDLHQGGVATVHRDQFTKHALITGFTGSGKTVTVFSLIHQLHGQGIPILVIESAKQEYRNLLNVDAFAKCDNPLWVFTAGNESCSPLRINPFEILPHVRVESHISRLQTCFEAALPPIGPLASMIGEALIDVYQRLGWRLTDVGPEIGEPMHLRFPTMRDFYERMSSLVSERGYEGEVRSNVSAAVLGRIRPLTVGTKGLLFRNDRDIRIGEPRQSSLISTLFARSTIIELNDLNLDDKALITMFILTFLREYRERHASQDGSLVHATVVEEAHNVLENVQSNGNAEGGSADTRFKAVQAFSQLLTEIRALGQSLIIADQSPEKLAPDALRNTNIQIAHQLRDATDRDAIARAMIMEDEQRDYLGKLRPGQAALFVTGLERATFVQVPRYHGLSPASVQSKESAERNGSVSLNSISDLDVRDRMAAVTQSYRSGPFDAACESCSVRLTCDHRRSVVGAIFDGDLADRFARAAEMYRRDRTTSRSETVRKLVNISVSAAREAAAKPDLDVVWCSFVHLWHRDPFNWTEYFPDYCYDTLRSVTQKEFPQLLRKEN